MNLPQPLHTSVSYKYKHWTVNDIHFLYAHPIVDVRLLQHSEVTYIYTLTHLHTAGGFVRAPFTHSLYLKRSFFLFSFNNAVYMHICKHLLLQPANNKIIVHSRVDASNSLTTTQTHRNYFDRTCFCLFVKGNLYINQQYSNVVDIGRKLSVDAAVGLCHFKTLVGIN